MPSNDVCPIGVDVDNKDSFLPGKCACLRRMIEKSSRELTDVGLKNALVDYFIYHFYIANQQVH